MAFMELPGGQVLAVEALGPESGTPLVFWHGGGQTRGSWRTVASRFAARGFRCLLPDLRGHGESARARPGHYELDHFADDVTGLASRLDRPAIHVGASLGGTASALALGEEPAPEALALLLVDIAPRVSMVGVRRITRFMGAHRDGFADAEAAADAVEEFWPGRSRGRSATRLLGNLRERPEGGLVWHWDPVFLTPVDEDGGHQHIDPERFERALSRIRVPVGLVWGGRSDLVTEETVAHLQRSSPQVALIRIDSASHMVVGDDNAAFLAGMDRFLSSHGFLDEGAR